jgi:hypothetical protein
MALWSNTDANTSAPKFAPASGLGVAANGSTLFSNTTQDVFVTGAALGVFGVDTTEQQATTTAKGGHAGWVLRKVGSGGRAGRVQVETLVAMGSMSGDDEDVAYPDYRIEILTQPQNASNTAGNTASFSVGAQTVPTGGSLSYQWYVDEDGAGSGALITGATNTTLSLTNIATSNVYYAVVSVTGGNDVTSANAALTIDA